MHDESIKSRLADFKMFVGKSGWLLGVLLLNSSCDWMHVSDQIELEREISFNTLHSILFNRVLYNL